MSDPAPPVDSAVDPRLLEILVCPLTKAPLEYDRVANELISRKGYRTAIGYIQKRLVPFWRQLGFTAREGRAGFRFSDYDYVECSRELPARHDALTIDSDPYVVMRPEGAWDRENVLDRSALRPAVA